MRRNMVQWNGQSCIVCGGECNVWGVVNVKGEESVDDDDDNDGDDVGCELMYLVV